MVRRWIIVCICASHLLYFCGCTSTRAVSLPEYQKNPGPVISKLVTNDGEVYIFDVEGGRGAVVQNDEVVGFLKYGGQKRIPVSEVQSVSYDHPDAGKSVLLGVGIIAGAAVVFAGIFTLMFANSLDEAINH